MFAAHKGHTECVNALLAGGASVDTKSDIGLTALMYAAQNGHAECAALLAGDDTTQALCVKKCVVCWERPAVMIYPCGHLCACLTCSVQAGARCPYCRTEGAAKRVYCP